MIGTGTVFRNPIIASLPLDSKVSTRARLRSRRPRRGRRGMASGDGPVSFSDEGLLYNPKVCWFLSASAQSKSETKPVVSHGPISVRSAGRFAGCGSLLQRRPEPGSGRPRRGGKNLRAQQKCTEATATRADRGSGLPPASPCKVQRKMCMSQHLGVELRHCGVLGPGLAVCLNRSERHLRKKPPLKSVFSDCRA